MKVDVYGDIDRLPIGTADLGVDGRLRPLLQTIPDRLLPKTPVMIYLDALRATQVQSILTSRYGAVIAADLVARIEREQARNLRVLATSIGG